MKLDPTNIDLAILREFQIDFGQERADSPDTLPPRPVHRDDAAIGARGVAGERPLVGLVGAGLDHGRERIEIAASVEGIASSGALETR